MTDMVFSLRAMGPSGSLTDVDVRIFSPVEVPASGDFICTYEISTLGLSGSVNAGDPFMALRFALFHMKTKLIHRHEGWRFFYGDGEEILLVQDGAP